MKLLRALLIIISLTWCIFIHAQKPRFQFDHLGTDKGLSQSNVLSILQDSRGFMWFGTNDGLNKYDGYKFTIYRNDLKNPKSISGNFIKDMTQAANGDIWFATIGGGISRFDRRKEQFINFRNNPKDENTVTRDDVNSILEDSEGKLWIGTTMGLDVYDPIIKKFTHYKHSEKDLNTLSDDYINDIIEDNYHNIWIATANGLNMYNRTNRKFTRFLHIARDPNTIASNEITAVFEDSEQRIWVGTARNGLDIFDRNKGIFDHYVHDPDIEYSLSNNSVRTIAEDDEKRLWIGTENSGFSILELETGLFYNYMNDEVDHSTLGSNSINTIHKDAKNNMWLGSFNAGVDLVSRDASKFAHYKHMLHENSLSNNHVICFFEDSKNNIWIGTDGSGVDMFNPETSNFSHFKNEKNNLNSISGNNVLCITEDYKKNIWIGTWGKGISIYNPELKTYKHLKHDPQNVNSLANDNVWTMLKDRDKKIWIGTYGGGLDMYDPVKDSFTHFQYDRNSVTGLRDNWINSIFEDKQGNIWISTGGGGINIYNKSNGRFSYIMNGDTGNDFNATNVGCIIEDMNGNMWISTITGLYFLDRSINKLSVYTKQEGLPSNVIHGIIEDKFGHIWISTTQGISRFSPVTKKFKTYTVADGLQSNEFKEKAFLESSDGSIYFGGNNGFNRFFPQNVRNVLFDPPLVITNFQVFNKDVPIAVNETDPSALTQSITETKAITLPYSNSVFSFEFASLNYTITEKKRYAYMLEGFDKTWNEVGTQRTATYTNLDPGKYIFKVKGLNNDGQWSQNITSIEITITPPFWLTWWFRVSAIVLFLGSVGLVYGWRMKNIKNQKKELEVQVEKQTIQLVQANKEMELKNRELEQFAYVASHDLQEPLRTTSSFVELLQQQYKGKMDEKADKYLMFIAQSSERMKTLIKDLLDYSRIGKKKEIEKVDCNQMLQEVIADLGTAITEANAEIIHDPLPIINGYPTEIKQLFQNLIINAIKFRKKYTSPVIRITAEKTDDHWNFAIADNGIGIDEQHKDRIFVIFQRLHTRNEYPGSGIGLSHCKKIVELHKGKIWVDSKPGFGSTFHFTIQQNNN
jgi:signal transduction histidine kinase/ligand-binding sensor domain-containing protein